ncbi:MAG TPA: MFS transporter, partial [Methanomicrobiales archaeon]|nr:MFS transporter [Methanomicrobiales archaeon]
LVVIVFSGTIQMWMLYLFALALGGVSGIFQPAAQSMVPRIVGRDELMLGNTITQVTSQLSVFIGPLLAGGVIAWFAGSTTLSTYGVAVAFTVDACTFLFSVVTLWMMRVEMPQVKTEEGILRSIQGGIGFVRQSRKILFMGLVILLINFLFAGPALVGIPVLAMNRLPEGVMAYGLLLAAFAIGNLLGSISSNAIKIRPSSLGYISAVCIGIFGIGMVGLGVIDATWEGMAILFLAGILNGYVGIVLLTLLQKNTPPEMLGRLMSLVIIASMGLVPVSQALAGFALNLSFEGVFAGCGILLVLIAVWAALSKDFRDIGVALDTPKITDRLEPVRRGAGEENSP